MQFVSVSFSLISFISTEHNFLSFQIILNKFEGWKGRHFYGWPSWHLASSDSITGGIVVNRRQL